MSPENVQLVTALGGVLGTLAAATLTQGLANRQARSVRLAEDQRRWFNERHRMLAEIIRSAHKAEMLLLHAASFLPNSKEIREAIVESQKKNGLPTIYAIEDPESFPLNSTDVEIIKDVLEEVHQLVQKIWDLTIELALVGSDELVSAADAVWDSVNSGAGVVESLSLGSTAYPTIYAIRSQVGEFIELGRRAIRGEAVDDTQRRTIRHLFNEVESSSRSLHRHRL